jgi:hypothetical protein
MAGSQCSSDGICIESNVILGLIRAMLTPLQMMKVTLVCIRIN